MNYSFVFFLNSALLGVGLAMDAFSVSLANGLHEPKMRMKKMCGIAGTFGAFQAIMPMTGWLCVHTIVGYFRTFEKFIPWIALILLCYIGGSMLINGIRGTDEGDEIPGVGPKALFIQGIATSIDALSVGFTISEYDWLMALVCSLIIAIVTFFICMTGLSLGKRFGTRLSNKADILGGVILIAIGLEIFISIFTAIQLVLFRQAFFYASVDFHLFSNQKKAFISPFAGWMKAFSTFINGQ